MRRSSLHSFPSADIQKPDHRCQCCCEIWYSAEISVWILLPSWYLNNEIWCMYRNYRHKLEMYPIHVFYVLWFCQLSFCAISVWNDVRYFEQHFVPYAQTECWMETENIFHSEFIFLCHCINKLLRLYIFKKLVYYFWKSFKSCIIK